MKIKKNFNLKIYLNINGSNMQSNQKKEYLNKNFFSRKFFKDLGIVESVGNGSINILDSQKVVYNKIVSLNKINKRFMFNKAANNIRNLKKSGDLLSTTDNTVTIKVGGIHLLN